MDANPLRLTACVVDPLTRQAVHDDGRQERLTPREGDLLAYLVRHQDRAVSREELLVEVWDYAPSVVSRAADTAVRRLREKIEADPKQPDHVLTVFGEGYRFAPGRARESLDPASLTNLTREPEPFVGRQRQLDELSDALDTPGWITVVGPPGAGKTRLARQLALDRIGVHHGGVWFCDLTESTDLAGALQAIASALDVPLSADRTLDASTTRLARAVAGRGPVLLVIDNCEQVREPAARICAAIAAQAPAARVLATSREPLGGDGEHRYLLGALPLDEAVDLLATQAARARPDFVVDDTNRAEVESLVEQLERLPLALVLAAARLGAMSVNAMRSRMSQRFRLLQDRRRDGTARHRTLRATLDWSWDTLQPHERRALARCAVFRGGFTAEAAASVLDDDDPAPVLGLLCDRSLLVLREDRYRGYAFVREYATEKLAEDPTEQAEAIRRHGRYFAALARSRSEDALASERPNLAAATTRAVAAGDAEIAGATGVAATGEAAGELPLPEILELACTALEVPGLQPADETALAVRAAQSAHRMGLAERATALVDRAVTIAEASGDPDLRLQALRGRGSQRRHRGEVDAARRDLEDAVALAREAGDVDGLASSLTSLSILLRELGDLDGARAGLSEVLALEGHSTAVNVLHAVGNLALLERRENRFDAARELYLRSLRGHRERRDRRSESIALQGLGNVELDVGDLAEARRWYEAALALAHHLGEQNQVAGLEGNLGLVARAEGDLERARGHMVRALALFERMDNPRHAAIGLGNLGEVELLDGHLDRAEEALTESCARLLALGDRHSRAELLPGLVEVSLRRSAIAEARARVDEAVREAVTTRNPMVIAMALVRRGLVEHAEGTDPSATLREAEPLVEGLDAQAEVHRDLERLRALVVT